MCNCSYCEKIKEIETIVAHRNFDKLVEIVWGLMDSLAYSEQDRCYYKSILDGSWPSAIEILEAKINKLKNKCELYSEVV